MKFLYVKTYLYLYPHMRVLEEDLARSIDLKAALSYRMRGDALTLAERIADMLYLKERLIALRTAIDGIVCSLTDGERELFEYKYFRRRGNDPTMVPCSERQYFRMQQLLFAKIKGRLIAKGYTEQDFHETFGDFAPFRRIFRALEEGKERGVPGKRSGRPLIFQNSSAGAGRFPRRTNTAIAASASPTAQITVTCRAEGDEAEGAGGSVSAEEGAR